MRLFIAAISVVALLALGTSTAFAGEITGNGTYKGANGKSPCSFSGQEDQQWYFDNEQKEPRPAGSVVKGSPAHSQNWGQIVSAAGGHIGGAGPAGCNPHIGEG